MIFCQIISIRDGKMGKSEGEEWRVAERRGRMQVEGVLVSCQ